MIHSKKFLLGLINILSNAPPLKFQNLLIDLLERGLLTKDDYRHYNQCEPEDLSRTILVSALGKDENYCQAFLSILCAYFPWICAKLQQVSSGKDQTLSSGQTGNMRNQSYTAEQPAVKSHNYLTLLQDEQMALPETCIQNGEVACETGLDDNHSELQRILEDFFEMNMNCEQYEGGIDGIVKYLQDPRPLNTIALEQYFGHSSSLTDDEETCPSSVTPSYIKAKSRKRADDGDDRGNEIISGDQAGTPKRFRREAKTKNNSLKKKSKCSSPSALTKRQATQTKQSEEDLDASPGHCSKTLDALSPVTCSSGIDHLKELKNHVSHFGSSAHLIPVNKDDSATKGTVVSPPAGFQLLSSSTVPQHVINVPINGIICFLVLNENSQNLEIATLLQTTPDHSQRGSVNVSVIPGNASPVISNAASPASSVGSPTTPGACSPQSADYHWLQETTMSAQPVDVPMTPLSVGSVGPEGVEDCVTMVKEYLKDMTQHSYICHEHDEMLLEDIYVDVSMVEVQAETKSGRNSTKCLDKECRIYDIAERERRAVNMGNLFHISGKKQKETKVIALLGRAGIGKSVIVQRICHNWVNGSFQQFSFVFWFKCRTLNFTKQYTLKDLLFQPFLPSPKNRDEVFQYLCQNPHKVLLVFDDFEDLQHPDGLLQLTACSSAEKPCSVKQLLAGILQKKLLTGSTVLVTARPKETFNQYLGKVDKIVEVLGFSPAHVQEFLHKYFEDRLVVGEVVSCLQQQPYMLSLCHIPLLCRFICFVLKCQYRHGEARLALPPTLTDLFLNILQILLCSGAPAFPQNQYVMATQKHSLLEVSRRAFAGVQRHECVCTESSRSTEMSNFALNHGLLRPFLKTGEVKEQECGKTFSHSSLQNFLGALHLLFSEEIRCKGLTKIILLQQKRRKSQADWLDIVRRFLTGLAYREGNTFLNCLSGCSKANIKSKKQKCLWKYFSELEVNSLSASKLLELCHCVYEAQSVELTAQVAAKLSETLSFRGMRLTPSDILVLVYVMQRAPSNFAVDLRDTSIDLQGIKQFIESKNVTSFRVSICDAVKLWEHLEQMELHELLHLSLVKFSVNPFEVKSLKDIDDLDLLVRIHKERRFLSSALRTSRDELQGLPAVRSLQVLEFALGPVNGPQGFQKLTKILPSLVFLKYLDLEGPSLQKVKMSENKIGDKGAERLAEVLSHLTCLEKLILSRNQIADRGAQELARSLPNLKFLRTLSLYDNIIGDEGAEKLAEILPVMKSLKVLDVKFNKITDVGAQRLTQSLKHCPHIEKIWIWSPTITHWMSEHIQQIDVRINLQ
ncbi:MHC class II transactivator isoform X1 [Hypanus sabinus]|uniref:MHC class II transactivator isoform X1 n=2 Tax=Hypanus sabinus TaxID=79690 RepID=UPI0028C43BB4|nr:MHC class II transactivator isoform X1 [Hypanus sabinus]